MPQTFTVNNTGSASVGPLTVTLSGTNVGDFPIGTDGCSGKSVAAAASCAISVAFKPTAAGVRNATLTVTGGGSTLTATLTGTGTTVPLTLTPGNLDFGSVPAGTAGQPQSFTVKNTGGASSGPLTVSIGGGGASDFTITSNACTGSLAAGASCVIQVRFNPIIPGARMGQLTVTGSTSVTATLTGTGLQQVAWLNADIGATTGGSFSQSGSSLDVSGGGKDVWSTADAFQFVYQNISGDATITAKLTSVDNVNAWTKAMLMMRDGTGAGARNAAVFGTPTPANQYRFQVRTAANGSTTSAFAGSGNVPVWLRLVRSGSTFTGYSSADGTSWTMVSSATISGLPTSMLVGVGITSHLAGTLASCHFDFVSITTP
jgi:hypothetical protein